MSEKRFNFKIFKKTQNLNKKNLFFFYFLERKKKNKKKSRIISIFIRIFNLIKKILKVKFLLLFSNTHTHTNKET